MKPMMVKNQKLCSGFTLLELIIALAIIMIASGAIFLALRPSQKRDLQNASLQLQADLRYVQRRARIEGRRYGIQFERRYNRYRIRSYIPPRALRVVYLENGVDLNHTSADIIWFTPRGTPSQGFGINLYKSGYWQRITVSVAGGRTRVWEISETQSFIYD